VPTLILSGGQDLRTPTAGARKLAASIPDAQVLVVPRTGHSVLGTDFSGCAQGAVSTFFAGSPVQPCAATPDIFAPTPIIPTQLGALAPAAGVPGRPGRTLTAVLDTILDLNRQVIGATLQANQALPAGSSFGGLHGGYAKLGAASVRLHRLTFVAGVELSGTFPVKEGRLQTATIHIGGAAAANGAVRLGSGRLVSGVLGGRRFSIDINNVKLSRAARAGLLLGESPAPSRAARAGLPAVESPSLTPAFPLPGLARLR
jgi:hypothetical protein